MLYRRTFITILAITTLWLVYLLLVACQTNTNPPKTAEHVALNRYTGQWYEIASFPNYFQKGCSCTTAHYTLGKHYLYVANRCFKQAIGTYHTAYAKAWVNRPPDNSKLKVQFFWPFRSDYWILYVSADYQYAIVASPSRRYLWILARQAKIDESRYQALLAIAKARGFAVNKLSRTVQNCMQ